MNTNMYGNKHRGKGGNGFYHQIQNAYGFSGVRLLKQFKNIFFFILCRKLEVFPKHLQTQGLQPTALPFYTF